MEDKRRVKVLAGNERAGVYWYLPATREHIFNYENDNPVSLVMPYTPKSYVSRFVFIPVFDQFMPEGWLYRVLRDWLAKQYNLFEEFDIFEILAPSIEGFLRFKTEKEIRRKTKSTIKLSEVLESEDPGVFQELARTFLLFSPISGVQPKVLAELEDDEKGVLRTGQFVIKTFGKEFFNLAENEFLCMEACRQAGLKTPKFWISKNNRLFIVERFDSRGDKPLAFEEFASLLWKTRERKYDGSYEAIAKALRKISASPREDLLTFYKLIVINFLLKNGDAHLKNFGVLYSHPYAGDVRLAPAYDVVCTWIYEPTDLPALIMFGRKVWFDRKKLEEFGEKVCGLEPEEVRQVWEKCLSATEAALLKVRELKKDRPDNIFYRRFEVVLEFSLSKGLKKTTKRLPDELCKPWQKNKRKTARIRSKPRSFGI